MDKIFKIYEKITESEVKEFIDSIDPSDFLKLIFSEILTPENQKEEWNKKIKKFLKEEDIYYFHIFAELIVNLFLYKLPGSISLICKNMESKGFDGAFIIKLPKEGAKIFLVETKSSLDSTYDNSKKNYKIKKLNEALANLGKEYNKENMSNERAKEFNSMLPNLKNILEEMNNATGIIENIRITGDAEKNLSDSEKDDLLSQVRRLINHNWENECAVAGTLTREDNEEYSKILKIFKRQILVVFLLESSENVKNMIDYFIAHIDKKYLGEENE